MHACRSTLEDPTLPVTPVPQELAREVERRGGPVFRGIESPSESGWTIGWPARCRDGGRAALFAEGTRPLPAGLRAAFLPHLERLAAWAALARALEGDGAGGPPALPLGPAGRQPAGSPPDLPLPEAGPFRDLGIIACSPAMRRVLQMVSVVAASDAAVLIEGESGTGKELIARAIHAASLRSRSPFVSENCAACPEGLLESEFFGVERGAFTGAHRTKPGLLERAHGGTLFLDEIGEMDLSLQRKLLRALQEREVRRVGGSGGIPVDFRLVSATNRSLAEEARAGRFRPDLLFRIEVVSLRLPPLRERPEEIPHLARHFLERHAARAGRPAPALDPAALLLLGAYRWPGNVRELENEMWRAVALRLEALGPAGLSPKIRSLPEGPAGAPAPLEPPRPLPEVERELLGGVIRDALRRAGGNKLRAAQLLGIPKTTLYRRLRRYAIAWPPHREAEGAGG